jgi:hypothetical protein
MTIQHQEDGADQCECRRQVAKPRAVQVPELRDAGEKQRHDAQV